MPLIKWDEKFSVGVDAIDEQHKKLVNILNDLFDAMKLGKAKDILNKVFDDLLQYTVYHFSNEENFMDKYFYDRATVHKKEHKDLTETALDLQRKFKAGTMMISLDVMDFLKSWLTNHIMETDKKFGAFLNTKGVH